MEWFIGSVLIIFASISTITGMAIVAAILLVVAQVAIQIYRALAASAHWLSASARESAHHPE